MNSDRAGIEGQYFIREAVFLGMRDLRKVLCWVFAISSLGCLRIALLRILRTLYPSDAVPPFRNLVIAAVFSVVAAIFLVAWWAVWKVKPSARGWGIAASLIYVLLPLWAAMYFPRSVWVPFGIMLATGVAGLVAFSWSDKQRSSGNSGLEGGE
jgi:hypothetical protein